MQNNNGQASDQRRRFLKGFAAGGGAAALGLGARVASAEASDVQPEEEQKGYRETPHISDYYRTTKI